MHTGQWRDAAVLFGHICQLAGLTKSPGGGRPYPRACRVCGYYGHNRLKCPRYASRQAAWAAAERKKSEYLCPLKGGPIMFEGQLEWCREVQARHDRSDEGERLGIGTCTRRSRCAWDSDSKCSGCDEWEEWMSKGWTRQPLFEYHPIKSINDGGHVGWTVARDGTDEWGISEKRARRLTDL